MEGAKLISSSINMPDLIMLPVEMDLVCLVRGQLSQWNQTANKRAEAFEDECITQDEVIVNFFQGCEQICERLCNVGREQIVLSTTRARKQFYSKEIEISRVNQQASFMQLVSKQKKAKPLVQLTTVSKTLNLLTDADDEENWVSTVLNSSVKLPQVPTLHANLPKFLLWNQIKTLSNSSTMQKAAVPPFQLVYHPSPQFERPIDSLKSIKHFIFASHDGFHSSDLIFTSVAFHSYTNTVFVLSRDGRVIYLDPEERKFKYWDPQIENGAGDFTCLSTSLYGHIAVLDSLRHRIYIFHPDTRAWSVIERSNPSIQHFNSFNPTNICFGIGSELYVAEYGNNRILKFDTHGSLLDVVSSQDLGLYIQRPRAICTLADGKIIILSLRGPRIYVLTKGGKLAQQFDIQPIGTDFSSHACLARGPGDFFAVGDKGRWKVYIYKVDGTLVHQLNVRSPYGIAFSDNYFWVSEEERNRITIW